MQQCAETLSQAGCVMHGQGFRITKRHLSVAHCSQAFCPLVVSMIPSASDTPLPLGPSHGSNCLGVPCSALASQLEDTAPCRPCFSHHVINRCLFRETNPQESVSPR